MKKFRNLWVLAKAVLGATMMGYGSERLFGLAFTVLICGLILSVSAIHQAIKIGANTND